MFLRTMNKPFNAREATKDEASELFQTNGNESLVEAAFALSDKVFVARTDFDRRPASFFGFLFKDQFSTQNGDKYGLILQVAK